MRSRCTWHMQGCLSIAVAALLVSCGATKHSAFAHEYVTFEDIKPPYLTLTQSWCALGVDDRGRAYIIWTSTRADGREDAALFRYTRATGKREFLGTFIDAATAANNIRPGEQIPKGHTRIIQIGRKLYMASQGFHDFKGAIDALPNYRGAHLFTYDLDTGALEDISSKLPNGVVIEHQGIVALAYSPEYKLLLGLSHPLGDIVLFDVETGTVRKVVPGIPWQKNRVVSREIVVTRTGKVYTYRGPEEATHRDLTDEVWVYDIATDEMKPTGQVLRGGFWNGQAVSRDRNTIYLSTVSGELYRLDVPRGTFSHLGYFIDPSDERGANRYRVRYLYGIALNASQDALLGVPIITASAGSDRRDIARLTLFDIAHRTFSKQDDMEMAVFTGSDHRDQRGDIYMSAFDWKKHCRLAIFTPRQ